MTVQVPVNLYGEALEKQIQEFLIKEVPVLIKRTTELGPEMWAVEVVDSDQFWIECFETLELAREFCAIKNLPVFEVIK